MDTARKNEEVVRFVVERVEGVGITQLQKLVYLADIEARKLLGEPITSFAYEWYDFGPFDRNLYKVVDQLEAANIVEQEWTEVAPGYQERSIFDLETALSYDEISAAEIAILSFVVRAYGNLPLHALKTLTYKTEPMREVEQQYQPLPMDIVNNKDRDRLGFDLKEVLAREAEMNEGEFVRASELFDGIRAKIRKAS